MKVIVVAATEFNPYALQEAGYIPHYEIDQPDEMFEPVPESGGELWKFTDEYEAFMDQLPKDHDELAEAAGRLCYKSWSRPNPATTKNDGYLSNILDHQHFSVLEHASVTLYVSGVSRNLLVELERHRHLSFSVVSQRYVNHNDAPAVIPPAVEGLPEPSRSMLARELQVHQSSAQELYAEIMNEMLDHGVSGKRAREAARAVLPGATETEFLVTGNHRVWREILQKRMVPQADAEMYQFAREAFAEVSKVAPATYQDINDPEGVRP